MKRAHLGAMAIWSLLALASGLGCQNDLTRCDITQSDCQSDVYYHLLSLRGDGYDPFGGLPPITVISEDQYRQQLLSQPQTVSPWDEALTLLHLQSTDAVNIEDEVTNIAAFYSIGTKAVTVVSHPTQAGADAEANAMITLSHEFTHALQDRELNLLRSDFQTTDSYLAYDTLIEGDARFYELLFANDLLSLGYNQSNLTSMLDRYLVRAYGELDQYGSSLFAARILTYWLGARYEAVEYGSGGNAAIRHGYASEPNRTVGFLSSDDGTYPAVGTGSACRAPVVSMGSNSTNFGDEFGALIFYAFMRGWGVSHLTAYATAQGWLGDSVRVQTSQDLATTAVAWRIELSNAVPLEVTQALGSTGELAVSTGNDSLLVTVSNSASPFTWDNAYNCP